MMKPEGRRTRRHAARLAALTLMALTYGFTRSPELSSRDRLELASAFRFDRQPLTGSLVEGGRTVREVHPSLARIASWISAVGASVALNDVDGDGLPNDVCLVETRTDQVFVMTAPGTGERFAPFTLTPPAASYDPATMAPMGCLPGDFNEDGAVDLLVYYWGRPPVAFLRRSAPGRVEAPAAGQYAPVAVAEAHLRWFTNAATQADVDGDGHADLVIGNYFQDGAAILDAASAGWQQMQNSMSRAMNGGFNRVLRWVGASAGEAPTVRFEEAAGAFDEAVARGWTLALAAGDLDGDLLPEIYFANDFGPDRLLHNRSRPGQVRLALVEGRRSFRLPASKVVGHDSFKSMGVEIADLDGDGLPDLYVSNIAQNFALHESHFAFLNTGRRDLFERGIAPFVDESEPLGLARSAFSWEARLADFNNDGVPEAMQATGFIRGTVDRWPELHELAMGNDELIRDPRSWPRFRPGDDLSGHLHNPFFVRSPGGRYFDLAPEVGLDQPQVSRGIATADVDGDGDLDFAVANQWEESYFYRNDSTSAGAFLGLDLLRSAGPGIEVRPGRLGMAGARVIGAQARVHLPDGRLLVAQVDGGNGHSGARSQDLHFGLGALKDSGPLPVEISWRDGRGRVRSVEVTLRPGWHTVLLGEEG